MAAQRFRPAHSTDQPSPPWSLRAFVVGVGLAGAAVLVRAMATLTVRSLSEVDLGLLGLGVLLIVLSVVAYRTAASRLEEANRHLLEVEHLYEATVETLAIAVDAKDHVTHGHIRRVQRYALALASALGVTDEAELKALEAASLLHDVGKLVAPDYVLNKPGALSPGEFHRIMVHADKGADILTAVKFPYPVVPIVRHHHEQWDGRGYPEGLVGRDIPLGARILMVVDCYDAVTSDRPYRRRLTDGEAIGILRSRSGSMYDPDVVKAFIELIPGLRRGNVSSEEAGYSLAVSQVAMRQAVEPVAGQEESQPLRGATAGLFDLLGPQLADRIGRLLTGADFCLFVPDQSGETLVAVYASPAIRAGVMALRLPVGLGVSGWVAANRHTIVNSPADLDLGDLANRVGLRSCVSTMVIALGNLACVLTVYSASDEGFSNRHVRLIGALAQDIGLEIAHYETGSIDRAEQLHLQGSGSIVTH